MKLIRKTRNYIGNKLGIGPLIANNRNSLIVKTIYGWIKLFLKHYNNANYNLKSNGEEFVIKSMPQNSDAVFFDVGFNKGEWTKAVLHNYPDARIFGFEPQKDLIHRVKEDFNKYENVKLYDFGLAEATKKQEIYIYEDHDFLSGIYNHPHEISVSKNEASFRKGSECFLELGLEKIDFLKIDVEGAEFLVLKGFDDILRLGKISIIQFEYGKGSINSRFLLKDYYEYLEPMGYKLGKIFPNYVDFKPYNWDDENFIGPNYLAVLEI